MDRLGEELILKCPPAVLCPNFFPLVACLSADPSAICPDSPVPSFLPFLPIKHLSMDLPARFPLPWFPACPSELQSSSSVVLEVCMQLYLQEWNLHGLKQQSEEPPVFPTVLVSLTSWAEISIPLLFRRVPPRLHPVLQIPSRSHISLLGWPQNEMSSLTIPKRTKEKVWLLCSPLD